MIRPRKVTQVRIYIPTGNIGKELSVNPDLYISRDGGVSWERTLAGSWGVNVADHGGLLVAAMDYHQEPSTVLKYICDEGYNWTDFTFIGVSLNTVEFRNPDTNGAEKSSGVLISEVEMHARVVLGVGKGVLFRDVSSVHGCPYRPCMGEKSNTTR